MSMCSMCAFKTGCDAMEITDGCQDFRRARSSTTTINKEESTGMKEMLEMQAKLQEFLGADFDSMDMEERAQFAKNHYTYLVQELNEALYELPFFKEWKNYDNMTVDEMAAALKRYKAELVDAFHFFMNLMLVYDMSFDELKSSYIEKNKENFERQKRGYTHDVQYGGLGNGEA